MRLTQIVWEGKVVSKWELERLRAEDMQQEVVKLQRKVRRRTTIDGRRATCACATPPTHRPHHRRVKRYYGTGARA